MRSAYPIVIIDDDASVRDSLKILLSAHGNIVKTYASGPAFLSREDGLSLMSVLLDLRMDGMGGLTVMDCIARFDRPIPVIAMTAHGGPEVIQALRKRGVVEVLMKPFVPEQLSAALAKADTLLRIS